jgi:hypothetical protein
MVIGELALGNLQRDSDAPRLLQGLQQASTRRCTPRVDVSRPHACACQLPIECLAC